MAKQSYRGEPYIKARKGYWHLFYRNPDPAKDYPVHKSLKLKLNQENAAKVIESEAQLVWRECEPEFDRNPGSISKVMERFIAEKIRGQKRGRSENIKSKYFDKKLGEVLDDFLRTKQNRAVRTLNHYESHLAQIRRIMDCEQAISNITHDKIYEFLEHRINNEGIHKVTANKYITTFRSIFNYVQNQGYISKNPMDVVEKYSIEPEDKANLKDPVYIPAEVYNIILKSQSARRHFPIRQVMFLLYHTGIRIGELLRVKWKDIDLAKYTIQVTASKTKGGDRNPYMVSKQLRRFFAIAKKRAQTHYQRQCESELSFQNIPIVCNAKGKEYNYSNLYFRVWWPFIRDLLEEKPSFLQMLQKINDNDIDPEKPISFHDFRHTFITDLLTKDINPVFVGWLVGHKELHTQRRYTHLCYSHFEDKFHNFKR